MTMEGSTCGLVTHRTTDDELHEFQNNLQSYEFDWDPSNNDFKCIQLRRSIGQVHIFTDELILLRAESHAHLQQFSVETTREPMSLIEQ